MNKRSELSQERYVAFLDVLGFKNLVEVVSHDELHQLYSKTLILNAEKAVAGYRFKVVDSETGEISVTDFSNARVACSVISDSILLYTKDDSTKSFVDICVATGNLLVNGMYSGMPMRGGISLGPLSVFDYTLPGVEFRVHGLVGISLVRAYAEESSHNWSGCTIDSRCIERYTNDVNAYLSTVPGLATVDFLARSGLIAQYPAPQKDEMKSREVRWVVNWPSRRKTMPSDDTVRKSFAMWGKSTAADSVESKLANTLRFLEFSRALAISSSTSE